MVRSPAAWRWRSISLPSKIIEMISLQGGATGVKLCHTDGWMWRCKRLLFGFPTSDVNGNSILDAHTFFALDLFWADVLLRNVCARGGYRTVLVPSHIFLGARMSTCVACQAAVAT